MQHSVIEIPRDTRRQLKRIVHKTTDKHHARRALAILQLWETGGCVAEVARRLCAARSSVQRVGFLSFTLFLPQATQTQPCS